MTTQDRPRTIINDDYAVLWAGDHDIYFGYEFGRDDAGEVWGFIYKRGGAEVYRISYEEMKKRQRCPDMDECAECLLFGIGLYLEQSA